jgi:phosphatidylserine/phosphatidylglycerophosphate/cardiolipin synthase-like enzyme
LVVDGASAFVGGVGITDDFDPELRPAKRWRETMVEMQGPVVADWQALFVSVWNRHAPQAMEPLEPVPELFEPGARARITLSAGPLRHESKRSLLRNLRTTRQRAWLSTAYFLPGRSVLRALRAAARRGVDVRLLLPGPLTDHPGVRQAGRRYYARLLRNGVRIFEYQPRVLHSKLSLCDRYASIGSSNHDRWNQRWSLEANLLVEDAAFVEEVRALFEADFNDCIELDYASWTQRPRWLRLWEWAMARLDLWLHALGSGRGGE